MIYIVPMKTLYLYVFIFFGLLFNSAIVASDQLKEIEEYYAGLVEIGDIRQLCERKKTSADTFIGRKKHIKKVSLEEFQEKIQIEFFFPEAKSEIASIKAAWQWFTPIAATVTEKINGLDQSDIDAYRKRWASINVNFLGDLIEAINHTFVLHELRSDIQSMVPEAVLQKAQSCHLISNDYYLASTLFPDSLHAKAICFFSSIMEKPLVAKIYKEHFSFELDREGVANLMLHIKTINEQRLLGGNLPVIVEPIGFIDFSGYEGTLLMEKAPGKSLEDIYKELASMNDDVIASIFSSIGEQSGNLDRFYWENHSKILAHTDPHPGNFFFDGEQNQLYWIDVLSGLQNTYLDNRMPFFSHPMREEDRSPYRFIAALLCVQHISKSLQQASREPAKEQYLASKCNELNKRITALKHFLCAYANATEIDIPLSLQDEWTRLFVPFNNALLEHGVDGALKW